MYFCLTMLLYFFLFLLAYMLYQLVFKFILPIYRTTKQVQRGFRDMQNQQNGQAASAGASKSRRTEQKGKVVGDYIDFEEVKEK